MEQIGKKWILEQIGILIIAVTPSLIENGKSKAALNFFLTSRLPSVRADRRTSDFGLRALSRKAKFTRGTENRRSLITLVSKFEQWPS
jgi:hypothetical protein